MFTSLTLALYVCLKPVIYIKVILMNFKMFDVKKKKKVNVTKPQPHTLRQVSTKCPLYYEDFSQKVKLCFYMLGSSYYIYISESMLYLIFRSIVSCSNDIQYKKDNMQHILSFIVYATFHTYTFKSLGLLSFFFFF